MIKPLQSLRFIAIFFVFLSHLLFLENTNYEPFFKRFLYGGYWGVTFFLVLSGFVISYNYYDKFKILKKKEYKIFLKKRILKLYPIHIVTFIIALPFSVMVIIHSPLEQLWKMLLNLSLLHSFIPIRGIYFSYNSVSWYLSTCLLLYILTPVLINLINKINKNNYCLIGTGLLIYIFVFYVVEIGKYSYKAEWLFYILPFFRIFDYILGLLVGAYIKNNIYSKNVYYYTFLEVLSILLFALAYYFYPYINKAFTYGVYYLPFMVFLISVFSIHKGLISKILNNRILVYLGGISFEFYMIHKLVIDYLNYFFRNKNPIVITILSFIISVCSAILLNKIITFYYQKIHKKIISN